MRTVYLLIFFLTILGHTAQAQEWQATICRDYKCALAKARYAIEHNEYPIALNQLESAAAYPSDHPEQQAEEVRKVRQELFDKILQERAEAEQNAIKAHAAELRAEQQAKEAEDAREEAENALAQVQAEQEKNERIISQFYFYEGEFALAYNGGRYGFIDKEGNIRIPFEYEEAIPFDYTGFARVKKGGQLYLIDMWGREYPLATELNQLQKGVRALDLRGRVLDSIPPVVFQYPGLQVLLLGDNTIEYLPPQIGSLSQLVSLDLRVNRLKELPPEIGSLAHLEDLNLAGNQLQALPAQVAGLKQLAQLDLGGNQLQSLPPELGDLKALTWLNLSGNNLAQLSLTLKHLKALTHLDVRSNLRLSYDSVVSYWEAMPWCEILWSSPTANDYYSNGMYEAAYTTQHEAVAQDTADFSLYYNLSWYALFAGHPEAAVQAARKTLELNPNARGVATNLALGYLLSGQWEQAAAIYQKWKSEKYTDDWKYDTWDEVFLKDIQDLEDAGITHPDFAKVKAMFKE